jgi:CheY-like chemotaxis protein
MKSDVTDAWHVRREQIRRLAQATEEAERANRAKTDFLSRVSHDMRTPLNGIMGLSALMRGETDPARLDADLDQLDVSGSYLMRLINDTLDLDRIERGKMRLDPTVRDARQAFSEVQELMAPSAKERGIDLTWHVCELTHDPVYIDLGAVEQVIVNVVGNAVKFTPRGGSVDVTVERVSDDGDSLLDRVTVRDDGIGISAEFLPHVFEPFAQERDDIAGRGQSSGLGMAITKQMCELMGGCISVESTEGEGTTVTLTLRIPRATAEQLAEKRAADEKADVDALQGKGVLLCEDNDLNAEIARRLLEKAGCVVTRVADGQQGVDRVSADPAAYDIVLMDMRMPRMNGLKATQTIRSLADPIAATVPIIAMTANTYDEDVELCRLAGMDGHLAKPIEPDRMYRMLASHLRDRTDAAPLT